MGSPAFVYFLPRRAVAAAAVTVFWMAAVFWRRLAVKRGSVDDAQAASVSQPGSVNDAQTASVREDATHPYPRADEVPAIFLSHSRKQKPFVENLYDALQIANHTAFFDKLTLRKSSPFPPHIIRAARGCKLGVVVLSEDFLTSKWPMQELEILIMQRDTDTKVLPIFYKLTPGDLKSPTNLTKWRRVWKEMAGQDADKWERAIKALNSFNGEVFVQGTSETAFIKNVVHNICDLVPIRISYDLSLVRGHQRLAQEVALQFEEEVARQCDNVYCMVGLYGVGGLGKTTMCHIMCNFYISEYLGKTCHIEFPSDGDPKKIVQECKKALKKLANLSDEHVLNKADSFEEVVQLMKENLGRYDVFLAIDNVWEGRSIEAAKRILRVSFTAKSKILLTSRSADVLKDLAKSTRHGSVRPLPSPDQDEAFQIFQQTSELDDLNSLVNTNLLHRVLNTCFFSGKYHALALKALGQHVKRVCELEGLIKIEDTLSDILRGIDLQNDAVDDLIRLNYVSLATEKKHMFLDIVIVVMPYALKYFVAELTYEKAHQWLSILYKQFSKTKISKLIYELALDGLIQLDNIDDKNTGKLIRVHDLYSDLAQREAESSARFFTDRSAKSVEKIKWKSLERVILSASCHLSSHFIKELHQQQCPNLAVLCVAKIDLRNENIHLHLMPALCVLKLENGNLRSIKNWSAATGLAIVHLEHQPGLSNLDGLNGLPCLERLVLRRNKSMEVVVGGLSPALKGVEVSYCDTMKRMPDLSGLTCLERLVLWDNKSMEEVVGGVSPALKDVVVSHCAAMKRMPDLSGLTLLERLVLRDNKSMEEVVGGLSPALKEVEVWDCAAMKRMPDLSSLTCLERLVLRGNESMEEVVGGLSPALKDVEVSYCAAMKRMPDLSGLTCLERLVLRCNKSMEEVVGGLSPALKYVEVGGCEALKRMPDVSGLTCVKNMVLLH